MTPEGALAWCRFVHDTSTMLLWGATTYLAALVPADLAHVLAGRLAAFRNGTVALALLTAVSALPIETAFIGNGWPDALDPASVRAVLFETNVGWAWAAQMLAALLLAGTTLLSRRLQLPATAATSGVLLATLTLTGHAAMHEGPVGLAHRLNDATHLLAGGAWLGALVPLLPALGMLDDAAVRQQAILALRRFSTAGHVAVALVIATGILNTLLVLGRWPTDWSSPYQALLAAKIAVVALMAGLAIINRYVLVPRLTSRSGSALRALRVATLVEVGLGVAAIACVSVFGLLEPQ